MKRLCLVEERLTPLAAHHIRVATRAVGLNFADIFALTGLYSATPRGSFIPGLEFAGRVVEVGKEAGGFSVGDEVMGVTRFGGYASVIDCNSLYCRRLPAGWSQSQGAAYLAQSLTAGYALFNLGGVAVEHVGREAVLVQSAAGGVGLQAMRICRKLGIHVIGTVGNADKKKFLEQQGFSRVVVRDRTFAAQVRTLQEERPLTLALDAIGGHWQRECFRLLAPTGRLVVFGAAEFTPAGRRPNYGKLLWHYLTRPHYDPLDLVTANKGVFGFNLIWLWDRPEVLWPVLDTLERLNLEAPHVGREFSFTEAHKALNFLQSGKSVGKIVLLL
jgi:alcohol dehydrogenase